MSFTEITWDDFDKIELRAGTIIDVDDLKGARKSAYILAIDFGDKLGTRHSSAQITDLYTKDDLIGKQVIAVLNFAPKRIAGFKSEVLVVALFGELVYIVFTLSGCPVLNGDSLSVTV